MATDVSQYISYSQAPWAHISGYTIAPKKLRIPRQHLLSRLLPRFAGGNIRYESADDAHRVFRKMVDSGHPPSDWDRLLAEARAEMERFKKAVSSASATQP